MKSINNMITVGRHAVLQGKANAYGQNAPVINLPYRPAEVIQQDAISKSQQKTLPLRRGHDNIDMTVTNAKLSRTALPHHGNLHTRAKQI
jgi:hypothetical protein